jgi:hypothetical protein
MPLSPLSGRRIENLIGPILFFCQRIFNLWNKFTVKETRRICITTTNTEGVCRKIMCRNPTVGGAAGAVTDVTAMARANMAKVNTVEAKATVGGAVTDDTAMARANTAKVNTFKAKATVGEKAAGVNPAKDGEDPIRGSKVRASMATGARVAATVVARATVIAG